MKIDFEQDIKKPDGKFFFGDSEDENGKPCRIKLTLREVCVNSVQVRLREDKPLGGAESYRRGALIESVMTNKSLDLKAEDIALLKERIAKMYNPLVVKIAWDMLDPKDVEGSGKVVDIPTKKK